MENLPYVVDNGGCQGFRRCPHRSLFFPSEWASVRDGRSPAEAETAIEPRSSTPTLYPVRTGAACIIGIACVYAEEARAGLVRGV